MEFRKWLDQQLSGDIPESVIAFNFNMYEGETENEYQVQLVGCVSYDPDDDDWACDTTYSSGEDLYIFSSDDWEEALQTLIATVKDYLNTCEMPNRLKQAELVAAGFVDGDLEIILQK